VASPNQTVLIIEDNDELRDLIVEFLRDDFATLTATSADEGMALARSAHPTLILCDLNLPGKNGLHIIEAVRKDPVLAHTSVIAMSGQAAPPDVAALSTRFLPKPFTVQVLMETLLAELASASV
jgi:CheY-like chemotaxis protein